MENEKHVCPICGEPTNQYYGNYRKDGLCSKHAKELKEGLIEQCENCGKWYYVENGCTCSKEETKPNILEECIICGENSYGYLFCKKCYHKYKNKELLIKIKNCTDIIVLDESYEGKNTCKDGHITKSKSEKIIDDYLFDHHIRHTYEKEIQINETESITPDFYLVDKDVYIEHWGFDDSNKKYTANKEYKLDYYRKNNYTLICTNENDMQNSEKSLDYKLKNYKKNEINFEK